MFFFLSSAILVSYCIKSQALSRYISYIYMYSQIYAVYMYVWLRGMRGAALALPPPPLIGNMHYHHIMSVIYCNSCKHSFHFLQFLCYVLYLISKNVSTVTFQIPKISTYDQRGGKKSFPFAMQKS